MRLLRFDRNAFGHGLGLLASLVFLGMGVVGTSENFSYRGVTTMSFETAGMRLIAA